MHYYKLLSIVEEPMDIFFYEHLIMDQTSNSNFNDQHLLQHPLNEDDLVVLGSPLVDFTSSYASLPPPASTFVEPNEKATIDQSTIKMKKRQKKIRHWKRPDDKPKRAASAYNLFFILERQRLLQGYDKQLYSAEVVAQTALHQRNDKPKRLHVKTHGMISFQDLSRKIATGWKVLIPSQREIFVRQAEIEAQVYLDKVAEWKAAKDRQDEGTRSNNVSYGNQYYSERPSEYVSVAVSLAAHGEHHHNISPENLSGVGSSSDQHFYVPSTQMVYTNIPPSYQQQSPVTENVDAAAAATTAATAAFRTNNWDEIERGNRMLDLMVEDLLAENIGNDDTDDRPTDTVSSEHIV